MSMEANELEYALRCKCEEVEKLRAKLLEAERLAGLGRMVGSIAHEVNTPLGIALTAASFMESRTQSLAAAVAEGRLKATELNTYIADAAETYRLLDTNLGRAAALVNSFRQVAVDQASERVRRFDVKAYLGEIVLSLNPKLRQGRHAIQIACPTGIKMHSKPGALAQVLTNLVINSLTHGYPGRSEGLMSIDVEYDGTGPEPRLMLRYADDGVGIAPEMKNRIFAPFFTTRPDEGSSGLGLSLVRNMVEHELGGSVACADRDGGGLIFYINLPCNLPGSLPGHPQSGMTRGGE